jgi:hypothetical protein
MKLIIVQINYNFLIKLVVKISVHVIRKSSKL